MNKTRKIYIMLGVLMISASLYGCNDANIDQVNNAEIDNTTKVEVKRNVAQYKEEQKIKLEYEFFNKEEGNASGLIMLSADDDKYQGKYDIYWANDCKKLTQYSTITSLTLGEKLSREYQMLSLLAIPDEANTIIAVKDTEVVATYNIPEEKLINSKKKFSFGAFSDIHVDGDGDDEAGSIKDFKRLLAYYNEKKVAVICNSGDITYDGRKKDVALVKGTLKQLDMPFYTARGNHDSKKEIEWMPQWKEIEPNGIIFEKKIGGEVFVFLGLNKVDYVNPFTKEQISKLKSILKKNKDRRVFLFEHIFYGEVGNIGGVYPYSPLQDTGTAGQFKDLMRKYKNVISFTGHSHLHFDLQRIGEHANVAKRDGEFGYRVHCSSASRPRKNDADTKDIQENTYDYNKGSLGFLVDVYDDYIVLKGIDFTSYKNLSYATYILDTKDFSTK